MVCGHVVTFFLVVSGKEAVEDSSLESQTFSQVQLVRCVSSQVFECYEGN